MPEPTSSVVPGPKAGVVPTTLALEEDTVAWLDEIAERTDRSRSDVAREIFRNVRTAESASRERRQSDRRAADS